MLAYDLREVPRIRSFLFPGLFRLLCGNIFARQRQRGLPPIFIARCLYMGNRLMNRVPIIPINGSRFKYIGSVAV